MGHDDEPSRPDIHPALAAFAERVRALVAATVTVSAPDAVLEQAAEEVAAITARLESHVGETPIPRYPKLVPTPLEPADVMPYDFVLGRYNPLAPPITFTWEDSKAIGRVTYTRPYEGPPGCVHGGVIAAAFDQVLSVANMMEGTPGPTAKLEFRYRHPTPLGVPLRFESWRTRLAGRRIHTTGRLLAGDQVTVEAEGIFVSIPYEEVIRMLDR